MDFLHLFGLNLALKEDVNELTEMWTEQPIHGYNLYIGLRIKVSPTQRGCRQK